MNAMRSQLTRHVFKRLLSSKPLVQHRHFSRLVRPRPDTRHVPFTIDSRCRRTFLGIFDKSQRDVRQPLLDPGMEKMLELDKRIHLIARPPPPRELVEALKSFVGAKLKAKQPVEDFHAVQMLQTIESVEERNTDGTPPWLTLQLLSSAMTLVAKGSQELMQIHNRLARTIYAAMQKRIAVGEQQELSLIHI